MVTITLGGIIRQNVGGGGDNLRWTSIPSRMGGRTAGFSTLRKPAISAPLGETIESPNYEGLFRLCKTRSANQILLLKLDPNYLNHM